jgi:ATP-binding cassette subfamily F protein 3
MDAAREHDLQLTVGLAAEEGVEWQTGRSLAKRCMDVHLEDITMDNPKNNGEELLTNTSLRLVAGRCYALIGRNGTGKTTLLRAMAKRELPGMPTFAASGMRVCMIKHEVHATTQPVLERVLAADVRRESLLLRERDLIEG